MVLCKRLKDMLYFFLLRMIGVEIESGEGFVGGDHVRDALFGRSAHLHIIWAAESPESAVLLQCSKYLENVRETASVAHVQLCERRVQQKHLRHLLCGLRMETNFP